VPDVPALPSYQDNGKRCQSPALLGLLIVISTPRAYHGKAKTTVFDDIKLPMLEDSASIQVAISQIIAAFSAPASMRAVPACSSTPSRSPRRILIAASYRKDPETVHSMTVTGEGDELARKRKSAKPAIRKLQ